MPTYKAVDIIKGFKKSMDDKISNLPPDNDKKFYKEKKRQEEENTQKNIQDLVPKLYWKAKIDTSIIINPINNFYLFGNPGTGKTHYTYALQIDAIKNKKPTHNRDYYPNTCNQYRNASFYDKEQILESLTTKPRLILDDLGSEPQSDANLEFLSTIINYRVENVLFLAFTSNLGIGKLPYSARIISRIAGLVGENKFEIKGTDRRLEINEK